MLKKKGIGLADLKERLDAYKGQPEQQWASRKKLSVGKNGQKYSIAMPFKKSTNIARD